MNPPPISALAAAVQAQIAAAIDRDLSMMMEGNANNQASAKAAAPAPVAVTQNSTPSVAATATVAETRQPQPLQTPMAQAIDTARATAASRQGSMTPLFADLEQALASPELPLPVKAVLRQVLAFQTLLDRPPTGQTIARAVAQSGLFLEAHLAAAGEGPQAPDLKAALLTLRQALATPEKAPANLAPPAVTSLELPTPAQQTVARGPALATPNGAPAGPPPNVPTPTAPVLIRGIDQALLRQSAAAPLAADLARALENPSLPAPVRAAIGQVLAQQAAPGEPAAGQDRAGQQATTQAARPSGPAPELPLAEAAVPPENDSPPAPELKAALLTLRQALASPNEDRTAPTPPRVAPAAPPSREAATTAQAAARGSLPDHADVATITQALTRGVDQAVARQTLHQLASLPDGAAQAWMFELPLASPQGAAIAQFKIGREGPDPTGQEGADGWRVRFSIDMEPLGPLHVHLHAGGGRASVNVWAERPTTLASLRSLGGELSRALQAEVRFQAGAPSQPAPQPGRFLDAST